MFDPKLHCPPDTWKQRISWHIVAESQDEAFAGGHGVKQVFHELLELGIGVHNIHARIEGHVIHRLASHGRQSSFAVIHAGNLPSATSTRVLRLHNGVLKGTAHSGASMWTPP